MVETTLSIEFRIAKLLTPILEAMGYTLVRVHISGSQYKTVQIMAERLDGVNISVEDCAEISREVSSVLDVEELMAKAYTLEVSSPGIDRPLVCLSDYQRYAGFDAKIEMEAKIGGRKKFKGRLLGIKNNLVKIGLEEAGFELPIKDIHRAKLLLTEEVLKATTQSVEE